jgi:hypothetical protein
MGRDAPMSRMCEGVILILGAFFFIIVNEADLVMYHGRANFLLEGVMEGVTTTQMIVLTMQALALLFSTGALIFIFITNKKIKEMNESTAEKLSEVKNSIIPKTMMSDDTRVLVDQIRDKRGSGSKKD